MSRVLNTFYQLATTLSVVLGVSFRSIMDHIKIIEFTHQGIQSGRGERVHKEISMVSHLVVGISQVENRSIQASS